MKRRLALSLLLASLLLTCFAVTQLQPALLHGRGALDGSFGLRPMSHDCAGLRIAAENLAWLPAGEIRFRLGLFDFRYSVEAQPGGRTFCLGQDLWYGE